MNYRNARKLSSAEVKRLEEFVEEKGGQMQVALLFDVSITTLSRTANRHTSPSKNLREKLAEVGVIKA